MITLHPTECRECHGDLPPNRPRYCCERCAQAHANRTRAERISQGPRQQLGHGTSPISIAVPPSGHANLYGLMLPEREAAKYRDGADAVAEKRGLGAAQAYVLDQLNLASRLAERVQYQGETGSALGWA